MGVGNVDRFISCCNTKRLIKSVKLKKHKKTVCFWGIKYKFEGIMSVNIG